MANPALLLSGIGMMLVGLLSVFYWKRRSGVSYKFFLYGAAVWVLAMVVKVGMDLTITNPLSSWVFGGYGLLAFLVFSGLYLGLRTGVLESGLSYLGIVKGGLRKMDFRKAIAFGIGFGGVEAFVVGLGSFVNILVFLVYPDLISMVPLEQQAAILAGLNSSSWIVLAPILERFFVLLIHVFSTLLVVLSARNRRMRYLLYSILFKALVDGMVPFLLFSLDTSILLNVYLLEVPIIILGALSYLGAGFVKGRFK